MFIYYHAKVSAGSTRWREERRERSHNLIGRRQSVNAIISFESETN